MEKKEIVRLRNVELTYNRGKSNAYQALHEINLTVRQGEFVVIFGPSGCGKSSLLNVIAGLEAPDQGDVMVDELNVAGMKEKERVVYHREKVGMIFQAYNLISTLNVLNNVALPQIFINSSKKNREERALAVLERFGIKEQAEKIPTELSGGQQQRIGIARAIINNPSIILADEPIGNLDSESAGNVMGILGELNRKEGKTVIMVSHNPENISWGTHIVYMKDGKIIKEELRDGGKDFVQKEKAWGETETLLDRTIDRFRGLSREQINLLINPFKAKIITDFLFIPFEESRMNRIEGVIRTRLAEKIDKAEMVGDLDRSDKDGGADLDFRLAKNAALQVERMLEMKKAYSKATTIRERAEVIREYILDEAFGWETEEKLVQLTELLEKRLGGSLSQKVFFDLIEGPVSQGGMGIDRRTAKKMCRKIDLAMVLVYGEEAATTE